MAERFAAIPQPRLRIPWTADMADQTPPETLPLPPSAPRSTVFFGPDGLRAGWRVAIFFILFAIFQAIWVGIMAAAGLPVHPAGHELRPGLMAIFEAGMFAAAIAAAAVMSWFERRSMADYGLPFAKAFRGQFWYGALWGFVALSALLLALRANGNFYFGGLALRGAPLAAAAASWAVAFVLVGFAEEYLLRGYALVALTRGSGFWPAAVILSVIFGALHLGNRGEDVVGALSAGLIGFFFCFTVRRTGQLWFAVGFHFLWDYSETFLYSVPDSGLLPGRHLIQSSFHGSHWLTGGGVGPEGSLLVFPLIAILFWLFARAYRGVKFPPA